MIKHNLTSGLDVGYDPLVGLRARFSHLFEVWELRVLEEVSQQSFYMVTEFVEPAAGVEDLESEVGSGLDVLVNRGINEAADRGRGVAAELGGHNLEGSR